MFDEDEMAVSQDEHEKTEYISATENTMLCELVITYESEAINTQQHQATYLKSKHSTEADSFEGSLATGEITRVINQTDHKPWIQPEQEVNKQLIASTEQEFPLGGYVKTNTEVGETAGLTEKGADEKSVSYESTKETEMQQLEANYNEDVEIPTDLQVLQPPLVESITQENTKSSEDTGDNTQIVLKTPNVDTEVKIGHEMEPMQSDEVGEVDLSTEAFIEETKTEKTDKQMFTAQSDIPVFSALRATQHVLDDSIKYTLQRSQEDALVGEVEITAEHQEKIIVQASTEAEDESLQTDDFVNVTRTSKEMTFVAAVKEAEMADQNEVYKIQPEEHALKESENDPAEHPLLVVDYEALTEVKETTNTRTNETEVIVVSVNKDDVKSYRPVKEEGVSAVSEVSAVEVAQNIQRLLEERQETETEAAEDAVINEIKKKIILEFELTTEVMSSIDISDVEVQPEELLQEPLADTEAQKVTGVDTAHLCAGKKIEKFTVDHEQVEQIISIVDSGERDVLTESVEKGKGTQDEALQVVEMHEVAAIEAEGVRAKTETKHAEEISEQHSVAHEEIVDVVTMVSSETVDMAVCHKVVEQPVYEDEKFKQIPIESDIAATSEQDEESYETHTGEIIQQMADMKKSKVVVEDWPQSAEYTSTDICIIETEILTELTSDVMDICTIQPEEKDEKELEYQRFETQQKAEPSELVEQVTVGKIEAADRHLPISKDEMAVSQDEHEKLQMQKVSVKEIQPLATRPMDDDIAESTRTTIHEAAFDSKVTVDTVPSTTTQDDALRPSYILGEQFLLKGQDVEVKEPIAMAKVEYVGVTSTETKLLAVEDMEHVEEENSQNAYEEILSDSVELSMRQPDSLSHNREVSEAETTTEKLKPLTETDISNESQFADETASEEIGRDQSLEIMLSLQKSDDEEIGSLEVASKVAEPVMVKLVVDSSRSMEVIEAYKPQQEDTFTMDKTEKEALPIEEKPEVMQFYPDFRTATAIHDVFDDSLQCELQCFQEDTAVGEVEIIAEPREKTMKRVSTEAEDESLQTDDFVNVTLREKMTFVKEAETADQNEPYKIQIEQNVLKESENEPAKSKSTSESDIMREERKPVEIMEIKRDAIEEISVLVPQEEIAKPEVEMEMNIPALEVTSAGQEAVPSLLIKAQSVRVASGETELVMQEPEQLEAEQTELESLAVESLVLLRIETEESSMHELCEGDKSQAARDMTRHVFVEHVSEVIEGSKHESVTCDERMAATKEMPKITTLENLTECTNIDLALLHEAELIHFAPDETMTYDAETVSQSTVAHEITAAIVRVEERGDVTGTPSESLEAIILQAPEAVSSVLEEIRGGSDKELECDLEYWNISERPLDQSNEEFLFLQSKLTPNILSKEINQVTEIEATSEACAALQSVSSCVMEQMMLKVLQQTLMDDTGVVYPQASSPECEAFRPSDCEDEKSSQLNETATEEKKSFEHECLIELEKDETCDAKAAEIHTSAADELSTSEEMVENDYTSDTSIIMQMLAGEAQLLQTDLDEPVSSQARGTDIADFALEREVPADDCVKVATSSYVDRMTAELSIDNSANIIQEVASSIVTNILQSAAHLKSAEKSYFEDSEPMKCRELSLPQTLSSESGQSTVLQVIRSVKPDGEIVEQVVTMDSASAVESLGALPSPQTSVCEESGEELEPTAILSSAVIVYADTVEERPDSETEMTEYEEFLPDGTHLRRKVIKTTRHEAVTRRVLMEEIPAEHGQFEPEATLTFLRYSDRADEGPMTVTLSDVTVQDTLLDGRSIVTHSTLTDQHQLVMERTFVDGVGSTENGDFKTTDNTFSTFSSSDVTGNTFIIIISY